MIQYQDTDDRETPMFHDTISDTDDTPMIHYIVQYPDTEP